MAGLAGLSFASSATGENASDAYLFRDRSDFFIDLRLVFSDDRLLGSDFRERLADQSLVAGGGLADRFTRECQSGKQGYGTKEGESNGLRLHDSS